MEGARPAQNEVMLGQEFVLKRNEKVTIKDEGLQIKISQFYNSPCPAGAQCIWAGIGVAFEYNLHGKVQTGMDSTQVFGYQPTLVDTDYETYARLVLKKPE